MFYSKRYRRQKLNIYQLNELSKTDDVIEEDDEDMEDEIAPELHHQSSRQNNSQVRLMCIFDSHLRRTFTNKYVFHYTSADSSFPSL